MIKVVSVAGAISAVLASTVIVVGAIAQQVTVAQTAEEAMNRADLAVRQIALVKEEIQADKSAGVEKFHEQELRMQALQKDMTFVASVVKAMAEKEGIPVPPPE